MSEQKKKSRVGFLVIVLFLLVLGAVVLAFYMPSVDRSGAISFGSRFWLPGMQLG